MGSVRPGRGRHAPGRRGAALAHVQTMLDTDVASLSPRLAMLVAGATALLDDGTNDAFERAQSVPDATCWPFGFAPSTLPTANGYAGTGPPMMHGGTSLPRATSSVSSAPRRGLHVPAANCARPVSQSPATSAHTRSR